MKRLTWWLRIVGCLYLLEGGGLSLEALVARDGFAAIWASTPVGALDEVAVRGVLIAGLPGVLTWLLLGTMMLSFSRVPARAGVLVMIVAAWELLVWLPVDLMSMFNGFAVLRAVSLMAIHIVIGVTGARKLRNDVARSVTIAVAARVTSTQLVVREHANVGPPALRRCTRRCRGDGAEAGNRDENERAFHASLLGFLTLPLPRPSPEPCPPQEPSLLHHASRSYI